MSDTPRTEAEVNRQKCWSDDLITIDANFACQLERELNAANDRIKSLIEERDRANRLADWKWNLRGEFESLLGTDKISVCIQLERELNAANDKIKRLEEEVQELKVVNEYAWQKNGKLNERIRSLIKLGLETAEYGLQNHREQWEQEEEL